MSGGKLEEIHDREVEQRRRSLMYSIALVLVVIVAIGAVMFAMITIGRAVHR